MNYNKTRMMVCAAFVVVFAGVMPAEAQEWWKPYRPPCTEREDVFAFTEKPAIKSVGRDKYEITFAVKGYCDVTAAIVDDQGTVVRHLGSGVLGSNAPAPFQRDSLKQTIYWNGKDDLQFYHKEPKKLKVRVMLGLKPTFEKRLGGTSPHNVPGVVWGLTASPDGVYVFSQGGSRGRLHLRLFDHDGSYVKSLSPPPANLPESKLQGMGYVEYEPGKRALHSHQVYDTVADKGNYIVFQTAMAADCQPAVADGKIYFCDTGAIPREPRPVSLHSVHTDGSMDLQGAAGRAFAGPLAKKGAVSFPRLAASPDGQWLYLATGHTSGAPVIFRGSVNGEGKAEPFLGNFSVNKKGAVASIPGGDNNSFQQVTGIDCDSRGRIYAADQTNNRIQVFSAEGKYLKTINVDRPELVQVHRTTGAIYVLHQGRVRGKTVPRLTKFVSFDDPREEYHVDGVSAALFALDSWSARPRLWIGGGHQRPAANKRKTPQGIEVYEEADGTCRKIMDFDAMARATDGAAYRGRWDSIYYKVVCDVTRNKLYLALNKMTTAFHVIDLESNEFDGVLTFPGPVNDIAFDKRGYLHAHFDPGFYMPGVGRLDPSRVSKAKGSSKPPGPGKHPNPRRFRYAESPYDYGVMPRKDQKRWGGILAVKDQLGAKWFQDGIGVNMRGDVAEECNIYYIPKMEEEGLAYAIEGVKAKHESGVFDGEIAQYNTFVRSIEEAKKRGEEIYSIKRRPGIPLAGGTVWTFDYTGEVSAEGAVVAGDLINGVQIDEDGSLYLVNARLRVMDDKGTAFMAGRGGIYGGKPDADDRNPRIGTLYKTRGKDVRVLLARSPVLMDPTPNRPPELINGGWPFDSYKEHQWAWLEGAKWLYAGASPIVFTGCSCQTMRHHTDWYKRSFVPEAYRHSIGVLDTNGNLILHIGRYGNLDSGDGPDSAIPVGGDGIAMSFVRFVGGTDDRLVFEDHGERIVSLKLDYHAEETVLIKAD